MACNSALIIFAIVAAPMVILAEDFIVGDEMGWTVAFDYQAWADGKDFRVGDTLVFQYPVGAHNVFEVNGTAFHYCIVPADESEALTSGYDRVYLATPGRKWYICGLGKHCELDQKLAISVQPDIEAPSMAPSSS